MRLTITEILVALLVLSTIVLLIMVSLYDIELRKYNCREHCKQENMEPDYRPGFLYLDGECWCKFKGG